MTPLVQSTLLKASVRLSSLGSFIYDKVSRQQFTDFQAYTRKQFALSIYYDMLSDNLIDSTSKSATIQQVNFLAKQSNSVIVI